MQDVEFKQGPLLEGWAIAAGVGLVALGVSIVVMGFDLTPAVAIAAVLFLLVGLLLGLPASAPAAAPEAQAAVQHATSFAAPAPLMASPAVSAPAMAPTPLMAAPVAAWPGADVAAPLMAEATRPAALEAARGGMADDLKQIKGVGPVLERLLHSLGYFHFDQIAAWTAAEVAWVDENLEGFKGRVTRDDWVPQARLLAAGGETAFSRRVEDGEVY
jgi:predicted flap endonuclease-1-like 5' DNA nuclease